MCFCIHWHACHFDTFHWFSRPSNSDFSSTKRQQRHSKEMENYKIEDYPCISDDISVFPKNTIWLPTVVISILTKICFLTGFIAWPLFIFPTLPMALASLYSFGFTHSILKSTRSFQKVTHFYITSSFLRHKHLLKSFQRSWLLFITRTSSKIYRPSSTLDFISWHEKHLLK